MVKLDLKNPKNVSKIEKPKNFRLKINLKKWPDSMLYWTMQVEIMIFFVKSDFWIFWSMLNVDFSRENGRFARFLNKGNVLSGLRRGAT